MQVEIESMIESKLLFFLILCGLTEMIDFLTKMENFDLFMTFSKKMQIQILWWLDPFPTTSWHELTYFNSYKKNRLKSYHYFSNKESRKNLTTEAVICRYLKRKLSWEFWKIPQLILMVKFYLSKVKCWLVKVPRSSSFWSDHLM